MIVVKSYFGEETNKACLYLSSRTEMIQTDDNTGNLVQFCRRSRKKCCLLIISVSVILGRLPYSSLLVLFSCHDKNLFSRPNLL